MARTCVRQAPGGGVVVSKSVLDTQQNHARNELAENGAHGTWEAPVHVCSVSQDHVPCSPTWTEPAQRLSSLSFDDARQCPSTLLIHLPAAHQHTIKTL